MKRFKEYSKFELIKNTFLQYPIWLEYIDVTPLAKLLYIYILDRYKLSTKNNWIDKDNNIYCYYTLETLSNKLRISTRTCSKYMKELEEVGLLYSVRSGFNKPNRIYVTIPTDSYLDELVQESLKKQNFDEYENYMELDASDKTTENVEKYANYIEKEKERITHMEQIIHEGKYFQSGHENISHPVYNNFPHSHTNINHTNNSHSIIHSEINSSNVTKVSENNRMLFKEGNEIENLIESIKKQIDYSSLIERYDREVIDEYVMIIADVLDSNEKTIKIRGLDKTPELVKAQYRRLNYFNIEEAISRLEENPVRIQNITNYIKSLLYDVSMSNQSKIKNTVEYELNYGTE